MSCICNQLKLPVVTECKPIMGAQISMSNGESYTIKANDLVAIQFVRNDEKIFVRRGRVRDVVLVDKRQLSTNKDNVSRIILDCSEQYTVKVIEIKIKDVIKIDDISAEFPDYSDRITKLEPNYVEENTIPVREHGMITEEELEDKITKPDIDDVVKMDPDTGIFNDLKAASQIVTRVTEEDDEMTRRVEAIKRAGLIGMPIMM